MIDGNYKRSLVFVVIFLLFTPIALASSIYALVTVSTSLPGEFDGQVLAEHVLQEENLINAPQGGVYVYASLPNNMPSVEASVEIKDARVEIVRRYLKNYNSPLLAYADFIVQTADEHEVDYRLITAIAQQESNLCKRIPPNSYNCWGWGIHSRGTLGFESYEEGIATVTKGLKEEYLNKGYLTAEEIMSKYTPLSNGSWAKGVNAFMQEMQ